MTPKVENKMSLIDKGNKGRLIGKARMMMNMLVPLRNRVIINTTSRIGLYSSSRFISSKIPGANEVPHPPRLPEEDQREFERLQKIATSQKAIEDYNKGNDVKGTTNDTNIGEFSPEYHPLVAEFEGDKNPKTGEIGGPKQDPTRHGDWSFNGRVTDF